MSGKVLTGTEIPGVGGWGRVGLGGGGDGGGGLYLALQCHHQIDSCIQMGSDESQLNFLINCEGQSQKTVSTDHNF